VQVRSSAPKCKQEVTVAAGQAFLQELREFLQFLRSIWGVLAGISVLFPLSNTFVTVIPIDGGARPFQNLSPTVVTTVTMLTCIFLTFATFGRRGRFADPKHRGRYAWSARACFAGALAALAVYLLVPHDLYRAWITNNPDTDTGIAEYDGLLAALYVATFALFTQAFLVLAMLEYFPERGTPQGTAAAAPAATDPDDRRSSASSS
jgi:hypothetical protein